MTDEQLTNSEFDTLHGGRDLLPIEQLAHENEGAERFYKFHGNRLINEALSRDKGK